MSLTFQDTGERLNGTIQSMGLIGKGRNVNTESMVSLGVKLENKLIINRSIPSRLKAKVGDVIEFQVQKSPMTGLKNIYLLRLMERRY